MIWQSEGRLIRFWFTIAITFKGSFSSSKFIDWMPKGRVESRVEETALSFFDCFVISSAG
jgi:hypothetical protein